MQPWFCISFGLIVDENWTLKHETTISNAFGCFVKSKTSAHVVVIRLTPQRFVPWNYQMYLCVFCVTYINRWCKDGV